MTEHPMNNKELSPENTYAVLVYECSDAASASKIARSAGSGSYFSGEALFAAAIEENGLVEALALASVDAEKLNSGRHSFIVIDRRVENRGGTP
jgi:hypothetical protein